MRILRLSSLVCVLAAAACAHERRLDPIARYDHVSLRVSGGEPNSTYGSVVTPSGKRMTIDGFDDGDGGQVRFSPYEVGTYRMSVHRKGVPVDSVVFEATEQRRLGPVQRDVNTPWRLTRNEASFFILGENRINIYDPAWNYDEVGIAEYIARMAGFGMTTLRVFVFTDVECEECQDKRQLGALESKLGVYDEAVARRFDAIMDAAEAHDVQVIITLYAIGFTENETWKSWDDNPYAAKNGGPAEHPVDFFTNDTAQAFARKKLRYVLARWGYSAHLLAIDLLNEPEWDGPIPESVWIPWAKSLALTAKTYNPYGHLITAGPVGLSSNIDGDERPWYDAVENDMVQWHLYGSEYYDPQKLATEMTGRVRQTWQHNRPIFCGEYGYGGEDQRTNEHTHVGLWSAIFSGGGALSHSAPLFNIDSDEPMTPERGHHFRVLRDFLDKLPAEKPMLPHFETEVSGNARVWTLLSKDTGAGAVWLYATDDKPHPDKAHSIKLRHIDPADYTVTWVNDVTGETLSESKVTVASDGLTLVSPAFTRHAAARFQRVVIKE
jgi:hypothetical protein